jgi:multimeric flavodoxin WrbA
MMILGIGGSPRRGGNTDMLLKQCMEGAKSAGAETEVFFVRDLKVSGCHACHACSSTGKCIVRDDMQALYSRLEQASGIVIAAPVFFYGLPSGLKAVVDRCQCYWARKYELKRPLERRAKGAFISVGGTKGEKLFQCSGLTVKYFFDALNAGYDYELFARSVDREGDIFKSPEKLEEAFELGKKLARASVTE